MKKLVINADVCHMPIVDMATGHVVARSYAPYFDEKTLELSYLALESDDGKEEIMYIPYSAVCFVNDVCMMINVPKEAYVPAAAKSCKLIGMPLTAKAGSVSLFSFGSIVQTNIGEDGKVTSLVLNDGHSFLVPRDNAPESVAVNDAFASEAFNCPNNTTRVSPSVAAPAKEAAAAAQPKPETEKALRADSQTPSVTIQDPMARFQKSKPESEPAPVTAKEGPAGKKAETAAPAGPAVSARPAAPEKKPEAPAKKPEAPAVPEKKAEEAVDAAAAPSEAKTDAPKKRKKNKFRVFIAPIVAMAIFFVLYMILFTFFIKV